ncbi:MAG: pyridoxamine 5'-phosphate oxidase family protein [Gemmobacter sp.]|jgi:predicted pyridoxine 5'-phosphate oxidase superfamily flavin-nucleotide-binding protein|nr:pyridoxamine 5'-phosphate oxidase family protein [Gemmobacter sp.]
MSLLSAEVAHWAERSVLCWLASVDTAGQPNVSPKEIYVVFDETHIVIANIASPRSVTNIARSPKVCVSFIDIFTQKGLKVFGTAQNVEKEDAGFDRWVTPLREKAGPRFPIHSVIVVTATAVVQIVAPSYRLFPEQVTEQGMADDARRIYGVAG